ncbi:MULTISPECIES: LytTR family DNA-binding domain-containing protein [Lactobacillus]|uniref:Response regulator transcription factor n=1 Tax=Lactobacillus xujianguonis TaxID=2495899 RepID=A0A437SU41_9LACO|nr:MULTISPECIES: LytTR family DNA-binding domain-containing protein [Lactobacillus]RVU70347.1 response regulator transcription factor [Lactobacillus xujianguonis]RVU76891.1 response regulator transcription factor [Lactobacillus xujianguonis]
MKCPIIICDDDRSLADELSGDINSAMQNMQDDNSNYEQIDAKVAFIANTFEQVVGYTVAKDIKGGIYFLDIELSQNSEAKNGVDLAEFIKKQDPYSQIIFVTAYDKYAPLTYRRRIGAIDYINKSLPRDTIIHRLEETLHDAFDRLTNDYKAGVKSFTYQIGRRVQKVNQDSIYYIENSLTQHKVHMITENGESEFKGNISQLDDDNPFLIKVSQSCVVNPENIDAVNISKRTITFPNGDQIVFSRNKKQIVKNLLNKYPDISTK